MVRRNKKCRIEVRDDASGRNPESQIKQDIEELSKEFDATMEIKSVDVDDSTVYAKVRFPGHRAGEIPAGGLREKLEEEFNSYSVL